RRAVVRRPEVGELRRRRPDAPAVRAGLGARPGHPGGPRQAAPLLGPGALAGARSDDPTRVGHDSAARLRHHPVLPPGALPVLCVMGVRYFGPGGKALATRLPPDGPHLGAVLLTRNFAGPPSAFLCPRSKVVGCGGFEPALQGTEDWDLWMRLVFAGCEVVAV